jgi:ribosomal protein L40E
MTDFGKTICPECSAGNGLGAPFCAACGLTLVRPGMAARPADDDEDDDDAPRQPVKKPARPPQDAVQKGVPKKKPAPRPLDDDEDDAPRQPVKKKPRREEEPDEEPESMRDNTLLNMLFPVGVSIWAMLSNYLGVLGVLATVFGFLLAMVAGIKIMGLILPIVGMVLCLLAIPLGGLSFFLRPKKTTYGGVTGYVRAIIGILCGLIGLVGGPAVMWFLSTL